MPSLLFHDTTSRVPTISADNWLVIVVSLVAANAVASATNTSPSDVGDAAVNATRAPSADSVNAGHQAVRLADPPDLSCGGVDREEVTRGFLLRIKVDGVPDPGNQRRVFVEAVGQRPHGAALRAYDGNPAVGMEEVGPAHGRLKRDARAIR